MGNAKGDVSVEGVMQSKGVKLKFSLSSKV